MDVPAAAAGPWIALGAVLGILLLLVVGAVALRLRSSTSGPPPVGPPAAPPRDDLAEFFARPPGTPGAPDDAGDGWATLAAPAPPVPVGPAPVGPAPAAPGSRPGVALAAFAVATLLLVGVAAALAAAARTPEPAPAPGASPTTGAPSTGSPTSGPEEITARLAFEGVVLEEHAVGITAAHPELELTLEDGRAVAHLRLPTANCLATGAAPPAADPACRAARTEYADLASPDLRVVRDGEELTVSGRFDTYRRPPGGAAEETGRSYEVSVTVAVPDGGGSGWVPAEAGLEWDGRVVAAQPGSVVRAEG